MNINPQAMQMLKNIIQNNGNMQQAFMQNLNNNKNPMIKNLMQMYKGGNNSSIEAFARNICKERGINFDNEFAEFMKNFRR